jgi:hypothetical protein
MSVEELRNNEMMAHLLDALDNGEDIGHYGRLVFAMVAQYFLDDEELGHYLKKDADVDEAQAEALCAQVRSRQYSPPSRRQILEWQKEQDFPICPNPEDPDSANVYDDLKFPDEVYEKISDYYEHKARA